ncbi:MAG: pyrroline-5-carboxylate reductase family protein, partial [Anaerolineales bacterium]
MLNGKTIGFVGAGNMGGAMLAGLHQSGAVLIASDADPARLDALAQQYGVHPAPDNASVAAQADILVIAVKPQIIDQVLAPATASQCDFVLSIVAGVRLERLLALFGNPRLVRSMPNTPATIGAGMSAWMATPDVTQTQRDQAAAILGALGETLEVHNETLLDAATAISGSGPAYMFLIL